MEAVSRRPWESTASHPTPPHPQTQILPSIETLTRDVDSRPMDKITPLSTTMSAPRDSGTWSAHGRSGPYTPDGSISHAPFSANHSAHPSNASGPGDRGSGDFDDSRRGSVDSRMHQGMQNMDLGPKSPYTASANASQSSLVQGLNRERGILNGGYRGPRSSAGSGGPGPLSPSWPRMGEPRAFQAGRVAPPILENPRSEVYLAEAPTKGQAYAFPDPGLAPTRPPSNFSRRNSFAESVSSSVFSDRSRLPVGQQELPGDTHHHSLQHRQVESLRSDPESPNSTTPYSRTPELRVTHKLAERKRRSEMKDCFEQLRTKLPTQPNNKASKWETLARAIDYINSLEAQVKSQRVESDKQRRQIHDMEVQMKELSAQMSRLQSVPFQNNMAQGPMSYGSQHYANGADGSNDPPRTLPPIINGAMQGVQYGGEDRRPA